MRDIEAATRAFYAAMDGTPPDQWREKAKRRDRVAFVDNGCVWTFGMIVAAYRDIFRETAVETTERRIPF